MKRPVLRFALFAALGLAFFLSPAPLQAARTIAVVDLYLDGDHVARFQEASGGSEVEVVPLAGGDDPVVRKRPGKVKYQNITLRRGMVVDPSFHLWYQQALEGDARRKSGSIVYLDREGKEVLRLNLHEAWPAAFELGPVGPSGARGLESFTIGALDLEREGPPAPERPLPSPTFQVLLEGKSIPGVTATSALRVEIRDPGDGSLRVDGGKITLVLDESAPPELHAWWREVSRGKDIRKSITVIIRSDRSLPRRYNFLEAWPCRWKAPELIYGKTSSLVEELEFVVERVERP
jgi:phage tail-like protein